MCDHPISRRGLLAGMAVGVSSLFLPRLPGASEQAPPMSAEQAYQLLREGNARFLAGKSERPNLTAKRIEETAGQGQHPFATILSCSDSRVPVEHVFDRGIGDLFVIRVAGNVIDIDEAGTTEYGAGHLMTPLVVVMGHTQCGAVTAVVKGAQVTGNIPKLVEHIIPAVERAKAKGGTGDALILDAIKENVHQSIQTLLASSQELYHLRESGRMKIIGALYHIENGKVEWL